MSEMVMVRPIRTEADYEAALTAIDKVMNARTGTTEGDRLDVLTTLVEAYEAEHHAIDAPDPIAMLEFAMDQRGANRADLEPMIGARGRVSEVLTRKRPLSLSMIRNLKAAWSLPAAFCRLASEPTANAIVGTVAYADGEIALCGDGSGRITGIPQQVWNFAVSGYRVLPRWIEGRKGLLADLSLIRELRDVAARIAELIHRFDEADLVLNDTLANTLTREELGFPAPVEEVTEVDD